jgi:hypothetical protein
MRILTTGMVLWTLLVAGGAFAQTPAPVGGQTLPPFDLLVYVDRSKTIFTGTGSTAPNNRVAEMLRTVFDRRIDGGRRTFVAQGDRVHLYTFGASVKVIAKDIEGGDRAALARALYSINTGVTPDSKTDIAALLNAIADAPVLNSHDGRMKLVLIASDFVDDPSDIARARPGYGPGVCDFLEGYRLGQTARLDPGVTAIAAAFDRAAASGRAQPYMGLLIVEPKEADFRDSRRNGDGRDEYLRCVLETVNLKPVSALLERRLSAKSIRYDDVANDSDAFARSFVEDVFRATLPPATVDSGQCRPRRQGMECNLILGSKARIANSVSRIRFFADGSGPELFDVPVPVRLAPEAQTPVQFTVSPANTPRLGNGQAFVVVQDQSGLPAGRQAIQIAIPPAPAIKTVEVTRTLATDPLKVGVTVDNQHTESLGARALRFFDAATGGTSLGEATLGADMVAGAKRISPAMVAEMPDTAQQKLLGGGSVFVSATFVLPDGETPLEAARVPVPPPQFKPLFIVSARIDPVDGTTDQFDVVAEVRNPVGPPKRVTELRLLQGGNCETSRSVIQPVGEAVAPDTPPATVRGRIPPSINQYLSEGIAIAVLDSQTAQCSNVVGASPPPVRQPLQASKAILRATSETGRFELLATIRNPSVLANRVDEITLSAGESQAPIKRLPVDAQPGSGSGKWDSQTLSLALTEADDRLVLEAGRLFVGCRDRFGQECGKPVEVADQIRRLPLQIRSVDWAAPVNGLPTLQLDLWNPGQTSLTLTGVQVERLDNAAPRMPLPLASPVDIPSGGSAKVPVSYPDDVLERIHPRDDAILMLTCRQIECGTGNARKVPVPPDLALAVSRDPNRWSNRGGGASVTITVRNNLPYALLIKQIWAAADGAGSQPVSLANYVGATRPRVPDNGALGLTTPFPPDSRGLLAGAKVWLCVVGVFDRYPTEGPFNCRQPWLEVPIEGRTPPKTTVPADGAFDRMTRRVTVRATNDGFLPQSIQSLALKPADDAPPLVRALPQPLVVESGKYRDITLSVTEEEARRLERAFEAKVVALDATTAELDPAVRDARVAELLRVSDATLETNKYDIKVDHASRHAVYGHDDRTNVKARIFVTRQSSGYGDKEHLTVWLTDANGVELPGTRKDVLVTFNGQIAALYPVWVMTSGLNGNNVATINAKIGERHPGGWTAAVEEDGLRTTMSSARWFLFIVGVVLAVAGIMIIFGRMLVKSSFAKRLRIPEGIIGKIINALTTFATISGITLATLVGPLLSFTDSTIYEYALSLAMASVVSVMIYIFISFCIVRAVNKEVECGKKCCEYHVMLAGHIRWIGKRMFLISIFCFVIVTFLTLSHVVRPYENEPGIEKICVEAACR